MPWSDPEQHRQMRRFHDAKRRKAVPRLRIALQVLREYGLTWEYERACADEGIEDPHLITDKRPSSAA